MRNLRQDDVADLLYESTQKREYLSIVVTNIVQEGCNTYVERQSRNKHEDYVYPAGDLNLHDSAGRWCSITPAASSCVHELRRIVGTATTPL